MVTSCVAQDGGKSVTILLDGYDELPVNLRQNSFIADLLQHKVLPAIIKCISVIVTIQLVFANPGMASDEIHQILLDKIYYN